MHVCTMYIQVIVTNIQIKISVIVIPLMPSCNITHPINAITQHLTYAIYMVMHKTFVHFPQIEHTEFPAIQ